jgi:hypothetical protein
MSLRFLCLSQNRATHLVKKRGDGKHGDRHPRPETYPLFQKNPLTKLF